MQDFGGALEIIPNSGGGATSYVVTTAALGASLFPTAQTYKIKIVVRVVEDGTTTVISGSTTPPSSNNTTTGIYFDGGNSDERHYEITGSGLIKSSDNVFTSGGQNLLSSGGTISGSLVVTGDLTVQGTTTTVDTDNLTVKDNNITLNYSTGDSSSTANNAGITIQDAVDASTDASLLWKTASDSFEFSHPVKDLTASGTLTINKSGDAINLRSTVDGDAVRITFSSRVPADQIGHIEYTHLNGESYGSLEAFIISGTEASRTILADGKLMFKEGIFSKPASGTGAGTRKDANWDSAYTYSTVGHLPLAGGTLTGGLTANGTVIVDGGTGVSSSGTFHVRQNGDEAGNGIAITSSNSTSHRIWKDGDGAFNIGPSSNPNAFKQDLLSNVTIEGNIIASGVITAGAATVNGTSIIEGSYSDGTLVVFGGRYSSGGALIGYGVRPSTTDTDKFHSSTGIALNRSAYILDAKHAWYLGSNQTVAIGSDVTISKYMELTTSGLDVSTGITTVGTSVFNSYSASDPDSGSRTNYPAGNMFTHYSQANGVSIIGGQGGYTGSSLTIGEETGRSANFKLIRGISDTNGTPAEEFSINGVGDAVFAGTISSGAITSTGELSVDIAGGLAGYFNSGTQNVVARFESGDAEAWIDLQDSDSGTYGVLIGHDATNLLKIADQGVNVRMSLSNSGLLNTTKLSVTSGDREGLVVNNGSADGAGIRFSDQAINGTGQQGYFQFFHANTKSYGKGAAFVASSTEDMAFVVDGQLQFDTLAVKGATAANAGTVVIDSSGNLTNIGTIGSGAITITDDGADLIINSNDQELVLLGNRGATGTNLDAAYLRMKAQGVNKIILDTEGDSSLLGGGLTTVGLITADRFLSGLGTAASPAFKVGDSNSGFYDSGANEIGVSLNGVLEYEFTPTTFDMKNNTLTGVGSITSSGPITMGSGTAGFLALTDAYTTNDHLSNIGWLRSSGGVYIGYGAKQSGSATWVSTFANFSGQRNYFAFDEDSLTMVYATSQQTAVGSAITGLTEKFKFNLASGTFQVSGTTVIDSSRNAINLATVGIGTAAVTSGYMLEIKNINEAAILIRADYDNIGEDGNAIIKFSQDNTIIESTIGLTADNHYALNHLYAGANILFQFAGVTKFTMTNAGNFTATGNVTAYSDERLKENIQTLDGSKVLQMRGVSFTKDGKAGSGVIAQQLELIAPELVHTGDDDMGTKSVAYGNLVGYLIENAKQQQAEIDELKSLIKSLLEK